MKRTLLLLLCLVLALAPVACAETETGTASSQKASSAASATAASSAASAVSSEDASAADASSEPALGPYDARTYPIADATDKFHITGRTMAIAACGQTGMLFDHAAQSLHFTADCEGDVTLDVALISKGTDNKDDSGTEKTDHQLFTVKVDGVSANLELKSGTPEAIQTVTLAKGLSRGKHDFVFYKGNEASLGRASVVSVSVNGTVEKYT
ncbi:MAG: hypothetical protein J6X61_01820, partial [Clostridia bacterium]|nr:hypothetical protein [Clostridia bacterium]